MIGAGIAGPSRVRQETPYRQWQQKEGIPVYAGSFISDLYHLDVRAWPRTGQAGAFVNLADQEHDDAYVLEIAPRGRTEVMGHLFEATIFVLDGRGATTFWQPSGSGGKQTVEWQRGSLLSPPLNCRYQHFNLDGERPARLFGVTNAPMLMNLFRNVDFVFDAPYVFRDRYASEDDYFTRPGERVAEKEWKTNFIPDVRAFALEDASRRGPGKIRMGFTLCNNQMAGHSSEFPPGVYLKAHRHGVGAHVVILNGQGYSLLWSKGEERRKVDWQDGSVLSPKAMEYHQHFNTGPTPARYLALRLGALDELEAGPKNARIDGAPLTTISEREGGWQIDYKDEDPAIYHLYVEECAKHGATVRLPRPLYAQQAVS
jgi:quercetin dioxygenase-like cupin family protein